MLLSNLFLRKPVVSQAYSGAAGLASGRRPPGAQLRRLRFAPCMCVAFKGPRVKGFNSLPTSRCFAVGQPTIAAAPPKLLRRVLKKMRPWKLAFYAFQEAGGENFKLWLRRKILRKKTLPSQRSRSTTRAPLSCEAIASTSMLALCLRTTYRFQR